MNYLYEDHRVFVKDDQEKVIVNATFPLIEPGVVNVDHTYVDPVLRGQGVANELMKAVYNHAKSKGYQMVATCPYAVLWFKRHKDAQDILNEHLQAKLAPECLI